MARFKQLYKIIEDVVNSIEWNIPFTQVAGTGGEIILTLECTAFLNTKTRFLIDSDLFEVVSFIFNEQLIIKPIGHSNAITSTELVLSIPTYYHGTVRLTNAEHTMNLEQNGEDIYPIIYLYETQQESVSLKTKDSIERIANARLFILMSNDFGDMIQTNYDIELYEPMSNIEEKITNALLKSKNIANFTSRYERINHDNFGNEDTNGKLKNLLSDELSALELNIPLNINKCSSKNFNC